MAELRAVLLDAGGTLIHPDHEFILARLADEGIDADEADYARARARADTVVRAILESDDPGTDDSRVLAWFVSLLTSLGLPEERIEAVGRDIRARHEADALWVRAVPGTREMLRSLKDAGLRVAVISNANGRVDRYLDAAGLADELEFIIDSGAVGVEKPDARIFHMALDRMRLRPEECVYVGDTWEVDVVGARNVGIRPIHLAPEQRDGVDCISGILELPGALGLDDADAAGAEGAEGAG